MGTRKRYSEDEVLKVLAEVESGASVAAVCRSHGVTPATVHRWRERGLVPSVIEDTIKHGVRSLGRDGTTVFRKGSRKVIVNKKGESYQHGE